MSPEQVTQLIERLLLQSRAWAIAAKRARAPDSKILRQRWADEDLAEAIGWASR